jgi:hypothetical protein
VVKPISADVRRRIFTSSPQLKSHPFAEDYLYEDINVQLEQHRHTNASDDYTFLDEDESIEDEDVMVRSPNSQFSRHKRDIRSDFHVVYKRKDSHLEHTSDYSMLQLHLKKHLNKYVSMYLRYF